MAVSYKATEYIFSSSRVRSLENKLVAREHIERMLASKSSAEIVMQLSEFGFQTEGISDRELILNSAIEGVFEELKQLSLDSNVFRCMQYQYDCNNIKSVLKCRGRGVSPDGMLFSFGSVSAEEVKKAAATKDFSALPENMARAAAEAEETFAKTGNPQAIDLLLDRACFADMLAAAEASGVEFIIDAIRMKIDLINLLSTIRVMRMRGAEFLKSFLSETLLDGGTLPKEQLLTVFDEGESSIFEVLRHSKYDRLGDALDGSGKSLREIEKILDNAWLDAVKKAKYVTFGAEVLFAYLVAVEYEVKNIRIILAGKDADLPIEVIRERLRESYV